MTEPDELYTLRAQYWLGHYNMAVDEAKSIARRPMSPNLKAEREEFLHRAYLALGQYDKLTGGTPALQALAVRGQFESSGGQDEGLLNQLRSMSAAGGPAALTAAQVLLQAGQVKEALQCVHSGGTLEERATVLQIYLRMDRLDLAQDQWRLLKLADEDAVLTQLGGVLVALATGASAAADALHSLNMLTEQYGPSSFLLNLMACALMQQGNFAAAEGKLVECLRDHPEVPLPDTLINLIACLVQQNKPFDQYLTQMKQTYPTHEFCSGLERVTAAFDREAIKYKN